MDGLFRFGNAYRNRLVVNAHRRSIGAWWRAGLKISLTASFIAHGSGCTRAFYRDQADKEVSEVLAQKDKYSEWAIDNWHVYPDPRARFADDSDPDHPPKPPDDPAAYLLSPNPQKAGKDGVARLEGTGYLELIAKWDRENRERQAKEAADDQQRFAISGDPEDGDVQKLPALPFPKAADSKAETPATPGTNRDVILQARERSLLDMQGRPAYLLTLDQAAELAMFNSREYQDQRENLYLAALPVTQERFSFAGQFFAASEAIRGTGGSESAGGPSNNWTINSGAGISKVLPTGALLLLDFSNQTVFDFVQPKKTLSATTVNFNAIQPLLRGGGQAVALESLTQAERNLLYQIRSFARFRKELYVEIASSNGGAINGSAFQPSGVLSNGGGAVGSSLGVSGLTPGAPPTFQSTLPGPQVAPTSPGRLALNGAITPAPSGYLNTMLQKIQVYIDQENIDVLCDILQRFRGLLEGDVVGPLQVQSVEQQLLSGRATLLSDQQQYLQAVDAFKLEIGVPMQLSIEMDDSVLQPLLRQFRRSRAIIENEQQAVSDASALIPVENAPRLRAELLRLFEKSTLVKGTAFARTIRGRWAEWEKLSAEQINARLQAARKEIQNLLDVQTDLQKKGQVLSPGSLNRLRALNAEVDLGNFESALRLYETNYVEKGTAKKPDAAGERQRIRQFQGVVSSWQKVLVEARDEHWDAVRASWPELPGCCVNGVNLIRSDLTAAQKAAAEHAVANRLDLMNVRAQVVDSWRQLAVYANSLLGTFTAQYQLSASSPPNGNQPLNIGGSTSNHQLILNTELPLVRIEERNNYRASLIAYQRQRRALQEAEDLATQAVRNELCALRQYAEAYSVQKRQLELAYLTIDSSLESLQAPTVPPALPGVTQARSAGADGPAALTQQLLSAQRSLPAAQNGLLTIWINYLDARLQLYRDLELMPLDARGVWIDEIRACDASMVVGQSPTAESPPDIQFAETREPSIPRKPAK
jgi:hypothetical protein